MKNSEFVTKWILETVKEKYADDIALVVSHTTMSLDENVKMASYFVPITKRGYEFCQTFILNGEGFDIWGIDWDRLQNFADLKEYTITCLADGEVLYSRTPEDALRFEDLKKQQALNLADPALMRKNALEAYSQAKDIYSKMLFSNDSTVKLGAGYVLDYLSRAVAFSNLRYFKGNQSTQIEELKTMPNVPDQFCELYLKVIYEPDNEIQKKYCFQMIGIIQDFLTQDALPVHEEPQERNFQDLADWYCELSYTWLRIRRYAAQNDAVKTYMWGIYLQEELNIVCQDFGLDRLELMSAFDARHLDAFIDTANRLEQYIRTAITAGGGIIHEYNSFEEFTHEI